MRRLPLGNANQDCHHELLALKTEQSDTSFIQVPSEHMIIIYKEQLSCLPSHSVCDREHEEKYRVMKWLELLSFWQKEHEYKST